MNKKDRYFLDICNAVASNSKCFSRQIGSILVEDNKILSYGWNGPPRKTPHCNERYLYDKEFSDLFEPEDRGIRKCPRQTLGYKSGEGLYLCVAGHAERNVLINAAREGIATKGKEMFMSCSIPCTPCLVEIINAGIKQITVIGFYFYDFSAQYLVENSHLKVRDFEGNYYEMSYDKKMERIYNPIYNKDR